MLFLRTRAIYNPAFAPPRPVLHFVNAFLFLWDGAKVEL